MTETIGLLLALSGVLVTRSALHLVGINVTEKSRIARIAAILVGSIVLVSGLHRAGEAADPHYTTLTSVGNWEAYITLGPSGARRCGLHNQGDYRVIVYYQEGDNHFSVQLSHPQWKLNDNSHYETAMSFDQREAWTGAATGLHYTNGSPYIDADLPIRNVEAWMREFMGGHEMAVTFPNSSVPDWSLDLTGTYNVGSAFLGCVLAMLKSGG